MDNLPQSGEFCGSRYPTLNYVIHDPMHRASLYASDQWSVGDRFVLQPGLRYDQQRVHTDAGTYEAQSLQPRIYGVLTLGRARDTVVRGGYGHATTFAPLFEIERVYNPPAQYANDARIFRLPAPIIGTNSTMRGGRTRA